MKNLKSGNAVPAESLAGPHGGSGRGGLVIRDDHRTESFEYWPRPSELELAQLAAGLARTEKIDPRQLVSEAWAIYWEGCKKIREDYLEVEKRLRELEAEDERRDLPQPKGYPVTFQEMELLLLPKLRGRTAERAALFREFIFARMVDQSLARNGEGGGASYWDHAPRELDRWREAAQDDIAATFGAWRGGTYDAQTYARFCFSFLKWHRAWTEVRNSQVKAANAMRGWEKRRKARTASTGARPKAGVLRQILEGPPAKRPPQGLDGSTGLKKP